MNPSCSCRYRSSWPHPRTALPLNAKIWSGDADPANGPTGPADAFAVAGGAGAACDVTTLDDGSAVGVGRGSGAFDGLSTAGTLFVGKVDSVRNWA